MKCEYCGGNLDLEAKVCPYCGQINRQAQQHIQDMNHYQGQFEDTKKDVYTTARRYSDITVRAITLAVLVVVLGLLLLAWGNSYRIYHIVSEMSNGRHKAAHKAAMNEYLENGDFLQFAEYCDNQNIYTYGDNFKEYRCLYRSANNYENFYYELMRQTIPTSYYDAADETRFERLGETLDYFYKTFDENGFYDYSQEEIEWTKKYQQKMEEQLEALLVTYCHLSPEEAAGMKDLTKLKRLILIEERMGGSGVNEEALEK